MVDLGNWLGDSYVIAGASLDGEASSSRETSRENAGAGDLGIDADILAALLRELS